METYDRLTMAITRLRERGHMQTSPVGPAGQVCTLRALLTDDEASADSLLLHAATAARVREAVEAMGFQSIADVERWNDQPGRTAAEVIARYEAGRDVILHRVATSALLCTRAEPPAPVRVTIEPDVPQDPEDAIDSLEAIFVSGERERERDILDVLSGFPPATAGYIVFHVVARLTRRAAEEPVERLGAWLAVVAIGEYLMGAPPRETTSD